MSTTSGYGETPAGSGPEQPEWLRKAPAAGGAETPAPLAQPGASPAAPQTPYAAQPSQYSQPQHPQAQRPQPQYVQPQYVQPQHPQAQHPHPGQYPGYQPGAYVQPGSPWAPVDPQAKSRLAAGLLGIFLGALGIHRFYLGYTGVGIAMLLITLLSFGFLGFITGIWGLVEGILYLTDKTGRYSHDATGRRLRD